MRRGEIYRVDLEPAVAREASRVRPAVIVSSAAANRAAARSGGGVVTVVPVASSTDRIFPFQTLLPAGACGPSSDSRAQAEQVRTIATERLRGRIGAVPRSTLAQIDAALRAHLAL